MHPTSSSIFLFGILAFVLSLTACNNAEPTIEEQPVIIENPPETALDKMNVYVVPGDYYEMKIGVRGDQLTGVYYDPTTTDIQNCLFFFEGAIGTENPVAVKCYNPTNLKAPVNGNFKMVGDAIIAKLDAVPGELCEQEFTDDVGHSVVLDMKHTWTQIRVAERAVDLVSAPETSQTNGARLEKGGVIGVLEKRNSWLLIDLISSKEKEQGWIPEDVLYALLN